MAVIQPGQKSRNFTVEELIGRRVRIVGPVPTGNAPPIGYAMMIVADDEMVGNVLKVELVIAPDSVVEAKLTLAKGFGAYDGTEEIVLRDHIEVSFSAIVSEVE